MRVKADGKKLTLFFQGLRDFSYQGVFDMGLIISNHAPKKDALAKFLPKKSDLEIISVNQNSFPDEIISKIIEGFDAKKWIVIDLEDGSMPGRLYNQLRLLAAVNRIQIFHLAGRRNEEVNVKQPGESRVVVVSSRENLERIENPTFINLFGVVADLS